VKMLILVLFSMSSLVASAAAPAFLEQGWSARGIADAKNDAVTRASRRCGRAAKRVGPWSERTEQRTVIRCSGHALDRECDDHVIGHDHVAMAKFACK